MGAMLRNLNLKIARTKNKTAIEKVIGVKYTGILIILKVTRIFAIKGTLTPDIINIDCFEKKPEFFIEKCRKKYRPATI